MLPQSPTITKLLILALCLLFAWTLVVNARPPMHIQGVEELREKYPEAKFDLLSNGTCDVLILYLWRGSGIKRQRLLIYFLEEKTWVLRSELLSNTENLMVVLDKDWLIIKKSDGKVYGMFDVSEMQFDLRNFHSLREE